MLSTCLGDSASWDTCPWSQHVLLSPSTPAKEGIPGEGWAHSLGCILWIHSCVGSEIASQAFFLDHWPLTWDGPIFPLKMTCWNLALTPWACRLSRLPLSLRSPPVASYQFIIFLDTCVLSQNSTTGCPTHPATTRLPITSVVMEENSQYASLSCGHRVSVTLAPSWT